MTEPVLNVFVVDDDPTARMVAVFQMEGLGARISEFADGESCLAALGEAPDIVVLDIEMPGTDGIAVCRAIRAASGNDVQIVFASSHDDLETRLTAYDAGGNDYIVKPYAPEELARKIEVARRMLEDRHSAAGQARYAQQAAFAAMSSMSEMGVTQEFLRASFGCLTTEDLVHALCHALEQYGVPGLVALGDASECHCHSSQGACSELEISILGHARGLERIFQFRDRLAINYPHVTLLIPNLPLADPDRVGRLRDHLAVLAEGAEARFLAMSGEARRIAQARAVIGAVTELTRTLEEIERTQQDHRVQVLHIANDQLESLTRAFVHLGLTEGQEESLVALTQAGIDKIAHLQDYATTLSGRLRDVTIRLKEVAAGSE